MRKEAIAAITTICFITAIASMVGSASNKSIIETNTTDMERYVWYNGDREEHVFVALDEVAIFPKNVSEITNVTELIRGFDSQATLVRGSEFVTLVRLPNRLNVTVLDRKIGDFQNTTGNSANLVFYKGQKKDQYPIGLTGEIIVHFREDWDEKKIIEWVNEKGLEIIEKFSVSPNIYLFKAGGGIRSLELANQIYLSGDVIYAYPNWWETSRFTTKGPEEIPKETSATPTVSQLETTTPKVVPFISNFMAVILILLIFYAYRRKQK